MEGTMLVSISKLSFSSLVLLFSVLLASQTLAGKTSRRFIGLPETGERVKYSNASEFSKTLIIRHNLPGRIIFHESNEFWIEVLTTTPDEQNNTQVKISYSTALDDNNTILLQVFEPMLPKSADTSESDKLVIIILSSVGSFVVLGLLVSVLCYFCYWKKRRTSKGGKATAKELHKDPSSPKSHRVSSSSLGSGTPGPSGTQLLVVAVCACALHAQLQQTNVEINVYFPKGLLRSDSKVFLNSKNNNEVRVISNDTRLKIDVFDVPNAGLVSENQCVDKNLTCVNGACDPLTGKCVCPRKKRAIRQKSGDVRCVYRCDEKCPSGFFELSPCNQTHKAVCKRCRPQCNFKEFESVPCAGGKDRNCTDISKLPQIKVSPNIVYEDILKVKADQPVKETIDNLSSNSEIWLNRSSGLAIQLQILLVDFSTTFREVKHDANDNSRLPSSATSQDIVRNFCRSPVPDYYGIDLQESADELKIIKGKPSTPCPNYNGSSSTIPDPGNLLSCNGAENPTVRLFGVKSNSEDFWKEEHNRSCYDLKQDCDKCRNECTVRAREDPICNLTDDNVNVHSRQDFGEHFTYCFDCCFEKECIGPNRACTKYNSSCIDSQETCVGAKRFTIPITPVFPNTGHFKCHVELAKSPVFELETALWKDGKLLTRIEKNERNYSKEIQRGTTSYDYGYMILKHPSVLRNDMTKTVMISGKVGDSSFDVGWYKTQKELESPNPAYTLSIQPTEPFKINTNDWPNENCQTLDTDRFVLISPSSPIDNVEKFAQLTAKISHEQNTRVYKVYNTSGSHQVRFEVPQDRSVMRYAFPETVVFNDRSFTGKLLKNRTFWTIRLSGQVTSCPGYFMVRLTDQDRPDVDVYHFDIAITKQECSFTVEFHLPSGGDTNMIDKQFVVRLTDSRKTIKLILVSPRRIPDFQIPDIDDDFDLEKLEVLIPFGGAAGGMFLVLIAILIYGYKTRPKDSYHRDRDNELHFRHVLFVVWFVGMRLVKSFLLTLTVLFVILTAIHYTNVRTLGEYKTFHEQRKQLEEDFMKQMDAHRVQEINRQWSLLGEGKLVCDQKLKELNVFLERHFKEMREKQLEEMRRKSIILAAGQRIQKQFNATKAKFERERKRLNDQMKAYSNEINSRINQIQSKIEDSFWLKAAKGLYNVLDGLAKAFGSGIGKPFINWVGLSVSFPNINVNLPSFDDIFSDFSSDSLVPRTDGLNMNFSTWREHFPKDIKINIQEISAPDLNISRTLTKERAEELLALEWIVQLYESGVFTTLLIVLDFLWFVYRHSKTYQLAFVLIHGFPKVYELEKIQKKEEEKEEKKKKKEEKLKKKEEKNAAEKKREDNEGSLEKIEDPNEQEDKTESHAKSKPTDETNVAISLGKNASKISAQFKENKTENQDIKRAESLGKETKSDESKSRKAIGHGLKGLDRLNAAFVKFLVKLKELNYQINNTNLVPMCVLSVIGILSVYVVIVTAKHSMNVETLDVVGYFDLKMAPLLTMRKIVNTRITSNAFLVNDVHIPYYENRVNARIAFYRKMAKMYQAYQCAKADLHNEEYCSWVEEPGASCEGVGSYNQDFLSNLTQFECNLEPVIPQRFTKFDRIRYKDVHKKAIAPYVAALRGLILDTFYMLLIVIGIFIIFRILGIVAFMLLKKFDLVRQVKHYQTNQDLKKELTLPHCIKYPSNKSIIRRVGPLQMSEDMKEKFGQNVHEGKTLQWVK